MIKAALAGGFRIFEVSMQTPHALRIIESYQKKENCCFGVSAVTDGEMAQRAINAGVKFLSNQYTDPEIINVAKNNNIFVIQGAATPTEAFEAYQMGADLVKIYPAGFGGGPNFLKSLRSALPFIKFIAHGNVTLDSFMEYLKSATAVCLGSALFDRGLIRSDNWGQVTERAKQFTQKIDIIKVTK